MEEIKTRTEKEEAFMVYSLLLLLLLIMRGVSRNYT
jgi:hypothetical protein